MLLKKIAFIFLFIFSLLTFTNIANAKLAIANDEISLTIGETYQISLTDTTNVTYKSLDENICSVNSTGLIEAVGLGSTIVEISDDEDSLDLKVTVLKKTEEIVLVEDEAIISLNETYQIKAIDDNHNDISYKVNDETIASVSSTGLVTPLKVGETVIVLKSGDVIKEFKLKIIPNELLFAETKLQLKVGETKTIKPTNVEDGITYHSSNSEVLSVSSTGTIEALEVGSVVITASYYDLTTYIVVSIEEALEDEKIDATNIILKDLDIEIIVGDSYQIEYSLEPSNATSLVTYINYDNTVISVSENGLITALKEGVTTVTVDAGSCMANLRVNVIKEDVEGFNPLYVIIGVFSGVIVIGVAVTLIIILKKKK